MSAKRGSLATRSTSARSAGRSRNAPVYRNYDTGMRIARTN
jgi:formylglycine-generating enzyme required for sulfatase activity